MKRWIFLSYHRWESYLRISGRLLLPSSRYKYSFLGRLGKGGWGWTGSLTQIGYLLPVYPPSISNLRNFYFLSQQPLHFPDFHIIYNIYILWPFFDMAFFFHENNLINIPQYSLSDIFLSINNTHCSCLPPNIWSSVVKNLYLCRASLGLPYAKIPLPTISILIFQYPVNCINTYSIEKVTGSCRIIISYLIPKLVNIHLTMSCFLN